MNGWMSHGWMDDVHIRVGSGPQFKQIVQIVHQSASSRITPTYIKHLSKYTIDYYPELNSTPPEEAEEEEEEEEEDKCNMRTTKRPKLMSKPGYRAL